MSIKQAVFEFKGHELPYNRLPHNNNPQSERSVEIPIAVNFLLQRNPVGRLLEVGNVLSWYPALLPDIAAIQNRRIVDKFEKGLGIENVDFMDMDGGEGHDSIVSISTVEHIGQHANQDNSYGEPNDTTRDIDMPLKAIAKIYDLLTIGGRALVTVPFGKYIDGRWYIQFSWEYLNRLFVISDIPRAGVEVYALKIVDRSLHEPNRILWKEAIPELLDEILYDKPFAFANAIGIIELTRHAPDASILNAPAYCEMAVPKISRSLCVQQDFDAPYHGYWRAQLGIPATLHRKYWELTRICHTLYIHGMLQAGKRGLGFVTGTEHLPALFASMGCEIVAIGHDVTIPDAHNECHDLNRLYVKKQALNKRGICPDALFDTHVEYRFIDIDCIAEDLKKEQFDFIWSCSSMEYLGSIEGGIAWVLDSMRCLKNDGVGVFTTAFDCTQHGGIFDGKNMTAFRKKDLDWLAGQLHTVNCTLTPAAFEYGDQFLDRTALRPPYDHTLSHLKIETGGHIITSVLLSIEKHKQILQDKKRKHDNGRQVPITVLMDLWPLGYTDTSRYVTNKRHVAALLAEGLLQSECIDLRFCATHSVNALTSVLGYVQTHPQFAKIPFIHNTFVLQIQKKIVELYQLLESPKKNSGNTFVYPCEERMLNKMLQQLTDMVQTVIGSPSCIPQEQLQAVSVYHTFDMSIPVYLKIAGSIKKFVTVYDLFPVIDQRYNTDSHSDESNEIIQKVRHIRGDEQCICFSETTRRDLLACSPVKSHQVTVIPLAADTNIYSPCEDPLQLHAVRIRYAIPNDLFLVAYMTSNPRINTCAVFEIFQRLITLPEFSAFSLVLLDCESDFIEKYDNSILQEAVRSKRIVIIKEIAEQDLAVLYNAAFATVYIPLYEGTSIIPLQVMQSGGILVASNHSAIAETVGTGGILVDSNSDTICQALVGLHQSDSIGPTIRQKAIQRSAMFTKQRCWREIVNAYSAALSTK